MEVTPSSGWIDGFLASWSMILISEIGDKTFFIACLMAMRHPKRIVFAGAIGALAAMTVLSSLMGVIVPSVFSVRFTQGLAVVLFFGMGVKILYEAITADEVNTEEEMHEAASILRHTDETTNNANSGALLEVSTASAPGPASAVPVVKQNAFMRKLRRILSPILVEAFTLTFLAEWGDRSQLATIALAAAKNPFAVTVGGILGHAMCTGGAVICGHYIASHVSMRTVNVIGGVLFLIFAMGSLYELVTSSHDINRHAAAAHPAKA